MSAATAKADAPAVSIVDAFADPNLMGESFGSETREAWRAVLSGAFALPMGNDRRDLFTRLAGGRTAPSERVRELWAIAGRRSDKSHTAAGVAVYLATIGAEQEGTINKLSPGERGVILCLACDRSQAKVVLSYICGLLSNSPILSSMVERETAEGVELTNGIIVEVGTNSHRSVRGRTLLATVLDEAAFFRDSESVSPDKEVYRALVPSLATTGGMLIGISSPYAQRGLLYDKWRRHYGRDDDVLVVQGASLDFNPTLDPQIIADAEADDPQAARAEWHGEFRSDVEGFLKREVVDDAVRPDPLELPYSPGVRYQGFIDAAGGGSDEFAVGIAHREDQRLVVDVLRARRGEPSGITADYAELLKAYGIRRATSDRYGAAWVVNEFHRHGITLEQSARPKSELYQDALPAFNSGRVEIPPDDRLVTQLVSLERKTRRGGKDSIDHPPNGSDDRANAVAGLIANDSGRSSMAGIWAKLAYD
ncbi:hypothetical protein [Salinisphaera orenii]|uniref:hypothetical protein n=1 Tax=Salinisphaera orenii TaxID=856731 RepID=UPI00195519F6